MRPKWCARARKLPWKLFLAKWNCWWDRERERRRKWRQSKVLVRQGERKSEKVETEWSSGVREAKREAVTVRGDTCDSDDTGRDRFQWKRVDNNDSHSTGSRSATPFECKVPVISFNIGKGLSFGGKTCFLFSFLVEHCLTESLVLFALWCGFVVSIV